MKIMRKLYVLDYYFMIDMKKRKVEYNKCEQHYIEEDDIIRTLNEQLCEIILKYAETYIDINDEFSLQYLIYDSPIMMFVYSEDETHKLNSGK